MDQKAVRQKVQGQEAGCCKDQKSKEKEVKGKKEQLTDQANLRK